MPIGPLRSYVSEVAVNANEKAALALAEMDVNEQAVISACGEFKDGVAGIVVGGARGSSCKKEGDIFRCVSTLVIRSENVRCVLLPKASDK